MNSTFYDKNAKLWKGPEVLPLYNPKLSLAQISDDSAIEVSFEICSSLAMNQNKYLDMVADNFADYCKLRGGVYFVNSLPTAPSGKVIRRMINDDSGIQMSFDEIRIKTIRAAQNLQTLGYEPKQVFAFMGKNSHHVAPIIFGSISIGCPVSTLDPLFKKAEIIHMLSTTRPVLMFCDVENFDLVKECLVELKNNAKILTFGGARGDSEPVETLFKETNKESHFIPVKVDSTQDAALIVCSSGTTGLNKGVCRSHAVLLDSAVGGFNVCNSNDMILCFSSLYWATGALILIMGTICGATRLITTENFTPELQCRLIDKFKVTYSLNSPHNMIMMIKSDAFYSHDLSSWKYVVTGGNKMPLPVKSEINRRLANGKVHVGYGLGEIGVISFEYPESSERDTIGKLKNGIKIKIIDDDGIRLGPNEDGEICVKMNYEFIGYFGNKKATDEALDDEGFFLTGDIGHFDDDGYLYIVDRKKDLMKYCNYQISPSTIESLLIESPHVKSVCVVGIPDEICGDLPAAVIVLAQGADTREKEFSDMVADHFADYCKLRGGVYFVESLPSTPSGKMLRRLVKETAINLFNKRKI